MHAVVVTRFGGPEVLPHGDARPSPGQRAIDVSHAAVGLIDAYIREGRYRERGPKRARLRGANLDESLRSRPPQSLKICGPVGRSAPA
jgi:NADPH:quinone reductase-like Zn-dependent oxidoreductase